MRDRDTQRRRAGDGLGDLTGRVVRLAQEHLTVPAGEHPFLVTGVCATEPGRLPVLVYGVSLVDGERALMLRSQVDCVLDERELSTPQWARLKLLPAARPLQPDTPSSSTTSTNSLARFIVEYSVRGSAHRLGAHDDEVNTAVCWLAHHIGTARVDFPMALAQLARHLDQTDSPKEH